MPRKTQRELQAARNVQGADLPDARWYGPDAAECDHPDPVKNYLLEGYVVIVRQAFLDGDLMAYAIVLAHGEEEHEVFSIDTRNHGSVHSHNGSHEATDRIEIRPIYRQQDVATLFWDSVSLVYEHYARLTGN